MTRELPPSHKWQSILAFEKLLLIIGSVSGRVNVGPEISRNAEWLDLYTQYPINFFASISAITQWPRCLRPLVQYTLPQLRRVNTMKARMTEILAPEFEKRRKAKISESNKPNTMLQWVWDNSTEKDRTDEHQSMIQILATVPSTYTVAFAATQALFDLAARPEYIPIIREEFESVCDSCEEKRLTKEAFGKMTKLDSFLKESQRITPLALGTSSTLPPIYLLTYQ